MKFDFLVLDKLKKKKFIKIASPLSLSLSLDVLTNLVIKYKNQ
jgi:hypothetical protein